MRFVTALLLQDWWRDWFGETSAIEWIGLFMAALLAVSVASAVYTFSLRNYISRNRYPSGLRWLCLAVGASIALIFYTLVFKDVLLFYVFGVLSVIFVIVSIVLFFSSRKVATK